MCWSAVMCEIVWGNRAYNLACLQPNSSGFITAILLFYRIILLPCSTAATNHYVNQVYHFAVVVSQQFFKSSHPYFNVAAGLLFTEFVINPHQHVINRWCQCIGCNVTKSFANIYKATETLFLSARRLISISQLLLKYIICYSFFEPISASTENKICCIQLSVLKHHV